MSPDEERERWNDALAARDASPTPENDAILARVKDEVLSSIHLRVMTNDRYQQRTH